MWNSVFHYLWNLIYHLQSGTYGRHRRWLECEHQDLRSLLLLALAKCDRDFFSSDKFDYVRFLF
ncbi:hypothetical protein DRQ07_11365, partial [candidate division KSB1 bacterium]